MLCKCAVQAINWITLLLWYFYIRMRSTTSGVYGKECTNTHFSCRPKPGMYKLKLPCWKYHRKKFKCITFWRFKSTMLAKKAALVNPLKIPLLLLRELTNAASHRWPRILHASWQVCLIQVEPIPVLRKLYQDGFVSTKWQTSKKFQQRLIEAYRCFPNGVDNSVYIIEEVYWNGNSAWMDGPRCCSRSSNLRKDTRSSVETYRIVYRQCVTNGELSYRVCNSVSYRKGFWWWRIETSFSRIDTGREWFT